MKCSISENEECVTIVLLIDGDVIATAIVGKEPDPYVEGAWQLDFIEVDEERRRQGIGRELFDTARTLAAVSDKTLALSSDLSDDAYSFFRVVDPAGLRAALEHEEARRYVLAEGGDVERLKQHQQHIKRPLC